MKIGLIGLPGSGKSTVFRALTGKTEGHAHGTDVAVVHVPDPRTVRLQELYGAPKLTQPEITFLDLMAVHQGDSAHAEDLDLIKVAGDAEALAPVVQCFGELSAAGDALDPRGDLELLMLEMSLTDLAIVERRLQRLEAKGGRQEIHEHWEVALLHRCQAHLHEGHALRDMELHTDEEKHLRGFALLTMKPLLVIFNTAEDDLEGGRAATARELCAQKGLRHVALCAPLEEEIARLPAEEQESFAADFGLESPCRERVIHLAYEMLNVITFFTAGDKESHAWTISAGTATPEAAGKIHTDMQKGFIRAEVMSYEALMQAGSEKAAREHGQIRVEGREYIVQDGDILYIRFSR